MRAGIGTTSLGSMAAVAAMLAIAPAAGAQDTGSVSDYRLPAPTQTSRPTVQGPVDPENPIGVPARVPTPAPSVTPAPTPAPAPAITLPPPTTGATPRPARTPAPRATRPAQEVPAAPTATEATPEATAPEAAAPVIAAPAPTDTAPAEDIAAPRDLAPAKGESSWLIPALLGAALVGAGAFLMLRRRRSQAGAVEDDVVPAVTPTPQPVAHPPAPAPKPAVAPPQPQPASAPAPALEPAPAPAALALPTEPLALTTGFTAKAVRLSLVYATLQYELEIANAGAVPLSGLQVRADLASAHGSIGTREQLAPAPDTLELQHSVDALAPGEATTLKGEVRVPLQQIVPVTKGNARFLVPLVRFCLLGAEGAAVRRVFTAGPHDPGSNAIASIRLDAGPRNLRDLSAREIEAARSFTLDPAGAEG